MAAQFATVEEYIGSFPGDVRDILREVRSTIGGAVPEAGERISYGIAAFTLGGRDLVYFAGWKKHISVYPVPTEDADLTQELAPYLAARGTLKFPLGKPVPYPLIGRVGCGACPAAPKGAVKRDGEVGGTPGGAKEHRGGGCCGRGT